MKISQKVLAGGYFFDSHCIFEVRCLQVAHVLRPIIIICCLKLNVVVCSSSTSNVVLAFSDVKYIISARRKLRSNSTNVKSLQSFLKKNREIHGEFAAPIHGHILFTEHRTGKHFSLGS